MHYIGLIGYPLSHSVSPAFQQVALDYHGLDARYVVWETRPEQLGDVVANIRHDENWGANVTVPHKERVMSFLDGLEGDAVAVGAVNVIYKEQARLLGNNTDVYGFLHALENDGRFLPAGGKALILGAGGAARAVVYGLVRSRMSLITIANRDILRARALAGDMTRFLIGSQLLESARLVEEDLAPLLQGCDLIVNCTSLGMKGAQQEQTPFRGGLISNHSLVFDLVYNPAETLFMRQAREGGARVLGGLPMLVYQGAASFELWTGKKAPVDIMTQAARRALG